MTDVTNVIGVGLNPCDMCTRCHITLVCVLLKYCMFLLKLLSLLGDGFEELCILAA